MVWYGTGDKLLSQWLGVNKEILAFEHIEITFSEIGIKCEQFLSRNHCENVVYKWNPFRSGLILKHTLELTSEFPLKTHTFHSHTVASSNVLISGKDSLYESNLNKYCKTICCYEATICGYILNHLQRCRGNHSIYVYQSYATWWRHNGNIFCVTGEIAWSPVNSPHQGQWSGPLMFSLMCPWTNGWVKTRDTDDVRRHRAYYDVTVL